jgi:predicted transglutaminase-like cysteine proteinase
MRSLHSTFRAAVVAAFAIAAPGAAHAFFLNSPAANLSRSPAFIEASRPTLAPMGHVVLCAREPQLCAPRGGASSVRLSADMEDVMRRVNREVNRSVWQVADLTRAGLADSWQVADRRGDCEDLALLKRERLIEQGFSPRAMRLAVAKTPWGEGHAVLVVRTSQGDLVLDNRHDAIRPWARTDLTWLKIQSPDNPRRWLAI